MAIEYDLQNSITCGVDNDKAQKLIIDLYSYLETIKTKFNTIEEQVDSLSTVCKGMGIDSFKNSYKGFESNTATICSNIKLYIDDITRAKKNFDRIFSDASILTGSSKEEEESN